MENHAVDDFSDVPMTWPISKPVSRCLRVSMRNFSKDLLSIGLFMVYFSCWWQILVRRDIILEALLKPDIFNHPQNLRRTKASFLRHDAAWTEPTTQLHLGHAMNTGLTMPTCSRWSHEIVDGRWDLSDMWININIDGVANSELKGCTSRIGNMWYRMVFHRRLVDWLGL